MRPGSFGTRKQRIARMQEHGNLGHNMPPDLIDEALDPFKDVIHEAENWADGAPVENEAQMQAVDSLIAGIKAAEKAVADGKESEYRPHKASGDDVIARWKPTIDDLAKLRKCLTAAVDGFKRKLAAEREAERRVLEAKARAAMREAEEKARAADASNIEAQREAEQARYAAAQAQAAARTVESVKGLRLTWFYRVDSMSGLLKWINKNDRAAMDAFAEEYAAKHKADGIKRDGMRAWQKRVAT